MTTKKKATVIDFGKEAAKRGKTVVKKAKPAVSQVVEKGNNNTQIAGDNNTTHVNITTKASPKIQIQPSTTSIGGDPALKTAIIERFNKLGEAREKRFGKSAYQVMYVTFKKDFGIKNGAWTIIWNWPAENAGAIIKYLDALYNNTIPGRVEKAAKKEGYIHTKPQLFKQETELLAFLGYTTKSPEVKQMLQERFGVTSHAHLTQQQLWHLVCHLEGLVKKMVGE